LSVSPTLLASIKELEAPLTKELHSVAETAGWPSHIYSQLSVVATDDGVAVNVPESIEKEVGDLEYGIIGGPATPVLRKFTNHISQVLANKLTDDIVDNLFARGVLP
jgi:hypothetical protein